MELRHLRYFVAAAEEEHFGLAAERLHVTRSAISQIISALETELGTLLFERLANQVRLTPAGRTLLFHLRTVMADLDKAFVQARRVAQGETGTFIIGCAPLALRHSYCKAAIRRFHAAYPDVSLKLVDMPARLQPKALHEGVIQAGFTYFGPVTSPLHRRHVDQADNDVLFGSTMLDWTEIHKGRLGVAIPIDHSLADRDSVLLRELAHERFIVLHRSNAGLNYDNLSGLCRNAGFEPTVDQEVSTVASQLNLISVGVGIGLAVTCSDIDYPRNLSVVPLSDSTQPITFIFGWLKGRRSPMLEQMAAIISDLRTH